MKQLTVRLTAALLSLAFVCSALLTGSALDKTYSEELAYSFNGTDYICTATATPNAEWGGYDITYEFASVAEPITARMTAKMCFVFDNAQSGLVHVYRQELWDLIAVFALDLSRDVYGKEMENRTVEGASRELRMHYWLHTTMSPLLQTIRAFANLTESVPQLNSLYRRVIGIAGKAEVTELGAADGQSDLNGYVFEQANSDLQCLFLYGRDFTSLSFMGGLVDWSDGIQSERLARFDQLLFHPNWLQKLAEQQYIKKLSD